jgi:hypothetical protein
MTHQDAEEFGHAPNEPHDPQGKPVKSKYKAKRYVLESIWEEQWVECEADSIEEAEVLFAQGDGEIISRQMGELCETNLDFEVEDIKLIEPETKESDNE